MSSTGFSITPEELYKHVIDAITSASAAGWANLSAVIGAVRNTPDLRWASPLEIKNTVERAFTDKFGAKEAAKPKAKVRFQTQHFSIYLICLARKQSLRKLPKPTQPKLQNQYQRERVNLSLRKAFLASYMHPVETLRFILIYAKNISKQLVVRCGHDSLQSRTVSYISVIPKLYLSTLAMQHIMEGNVI